MNIIQYIVFRASLFSNRLYIHFNFTSNFGVLKYDHPRSGVRVAGNHLALIPFLCFPVHPVIENILDVPGVGLMGIRE